MKRRDFIAGLGGAAGWPLMARAQQRAVSIGYLDGGSLDSRRETVAAVHDGLSEAGYVEGRNLAVEYRWAEDHYDELPALAGDLVRRQVAVIIAQSLAAALAAKAATKSIPIVFAVGADPVNAGLVASLSRPGGNLTGMFALNTDVAAKRLEVLHELVPAATLIACLVNPSSPGMAETETREWQVAARILGVRLLILKVSGPSEFEAAFATLLRERAGGLVVSGEAFFLNHLDRLVALAARHLVPTIYDKRQFPAAGGLMSYGTDYPRVWHELGVYTGRILKGDKPADLPVQQVVKMQLTINNRTAEALGITFPTTLLVRADEVIE
jgi:putative tryptophan/tyrosine transport system substrate-binding protein